MSTVLTAFLELLVGGIETVASGVASGVVAMAKALFITEGTGGVLGLSIFGSMIAVFASIALSIRITKRVYIWVTSLGN